MASGVAHRATRRASGGPRLRSRDRGHRQASWGELFYDLVYVVTVGQIAHILVEEQTARLRLPAPGRPDRMMLVRPVVVAVLVVAVGAGAGATAAARGDTPPSPDPDTVYTTDHRYYTSPWYDGAWQEMIPFGCTRAPYYPRDASCPRARPGKHHGIDMFMPCGTRIRSAVKGRVVQPFLGPAYGRYGLKVRSGRFDFVIGHARRLLVRPGQRVRPGQVVARSGKLAAPDGCHLHFEKRPAGAGYLSAVDPEGSLRRTEVVF